ncbi:MAG: YchJ family metal-binding protein [Prolixibacteraceae bacterium]|jgi:SEC-C motif-containing protein|nr:YchJ family metal-binding protein [Prolixibacteraceae bacterium]
MQTLCRCGSKKESKECCELIIRGTKEAKTAEELMRSRYVAFTQANVDYLMLSHFSKTRPLKDRAFIKKWAASVIWSGLQIIKTKEGREQDETGFVEFKALYIEDGKLQHIHENSFFKLENSKWVYVSGEFLT